MFQTIDPFGLETKRMYAERNDILAFIAQKNSLFLHGDAWGKTQVPRRARHGVYAAAAGVVAAVMCGFVCA